MKPPLILLALSLAIGSGALADLPAVSADVVANRDAFKKAVRMKFATIEVRQILSEAVVADTFDAKGQRGARPIVIRDFKNATIGFKAHDFVCFEAGELLAKENGKDLKLKMYAKRKEEAAAVIVMNQHTEGWGEGDNEDREAEWWPAIDLAPSVESK